MRASQWLAASIMLRGVALVSSLLLVSNCNVAEKANGPPPVASKLAFTVNPSTVSAGGLIPQVVVEARDSSGRLVRGFTDSVTMTLAVNPANGVLYGTVTVAAVAGVATFNDLSIKTAGTGYRLQATAGDLTSDLSSKFAITAGPVTHLAFTVQPGTAVAGAALAPAVQVTAMDALENPVSGVSGAVTVAITPGTGTAGATLSGTTTATMAAGVATFSTLVLDKVGTGYTLVVSTTSLPHVNSLPFDVIAGPGAQLVFTAQPTTTTAGAIIAPSMQVEVRDAVGNTATAFAGTVTLSITTGTGTSGASLSGSKTLVPINGVATFSDLSINKSGIGYTLSAKSSGLAGTASGTFDILPGTVAALVFTVQPATTTAGATLMPAVQVTAQDASGNAVPGFSDDVSLSIGVNAGGGALSGTTIQPPVGGVATFGDLSIDKAGTGYRLQATAGGMSVTSAAFSITAGVATHLVFMVQPGNTAAAMAISPAVQVAVQDVQGNTVSSFAGPVSVAITAGTGTVGAALSGTTTVNAVSGVATFSTVRIDSIGSDYTLTASASGLTDAISTPFAVTTGTAVQLTFTVQPTTTTAGVTITPSVQVTARDAVGNTVTSFVGTVSVSITTGTGTPGASLSGTKSAVAVAGVATFSDLSIALAGTGYALSARSSGLVGATSASFDILIGPVAQIVFTAQPQTTTAGTVFAPAVQVTAKDAAGNTVATFSGNVAMSIAANPGGGTLSGTKTVAAVGGAATFSDLSIDKAGTGYRLAATTGSLADTSQAFSIAAGGATKLAFTVQPATTIAGATITPPVKVAAQDEFGNTTTGFTGIVTVAIGTNPSGGVLSGTLSVAAAAGVATFSDLFINKTGTGYTLVATVAGLQSATSAPFNVVIGTATQLAFTTQPVTTTAGVTMAAVKVTARDAAGNTASGYTGLVTVAIGTNPGGGTLSGTLTVSAASGVATFSDLSINRSGTGYTLKATATNLTSATSATFDILTGPASQLVFTAQPVTTTATTVLAPVQVTARDAAGNTVTSFTSNVTMTIAANPGGGTLSGTLTQTAVGGVATFNNLSIDKVGTGYKLGAAAGTLSGISQAFSITAGPAAGLVFSVPPSTTGAGAIITPAVQVSALDAGGNTATGFTSNVTVAIGTNPVGGTLSGTLTVAAVAGVAKFSDLSINKLGTGYTLKATSTGLTSATSPSFNIVAGTATQLIFSTQPTSATAGVAISPAVKVTARDALGNTASGFTGNVTVAIGTNPGGGTLSGLTTVAAVSGVATFSNLSIDKSGSGYTLVASANGLTGATSSTFNISPAALTKLVFTVQPTSTTAGATITPAVKVAGQDAFGNTVTSFTGSVTIAITAGTGTSGATLSGTLTVNASSGVTTFSNLSIDKAGADYHLTASSGSLTSATSAIFAITAGVATHLSFDQQPTSTTAGATIAPAVVVSVRDALGNTVKTFAGNVTMAIAVNPGGGTLSGTLTVAVVMGVATFSDLSINSVGTGYKLGASASGLTSATSTAFSIN